MEPIEFQKRVEATYQQVGQYIQKKGNPRFKQLWGDWDKRFNWLYTEANEKPEVAISMVGGTGAGKSTLLNALIGARVLPVSNMRACTAAISEVTYADGPYKAVIEFISRESWEKETELLIADLRDSRREELTSADDPRHGISKAAFDRLWTVYHKEGETDRNQFDPFNLVEPDTVKAVLDHGKASLQNHDLKGFRKAVSKFLDSKHRYWPIVKTVHIEGPFDALREGTRLIDLPGINDPNEAREEVTQKHLSTCRFVWIVFNIKRALTKDTMNLMQSDDFLRQIVMDGRKDALTFVGTAADDIDIESAIDEFDLDEDTEIREIIAARNETVQDVVQEQLDELAHRLAKLSNEEKVNGDKLAQTLKASQIYTVSAKEFMRISGLSKAQSGGLEHIDETQIPALRTHMQEISASFGVSAHIRSLRRQLNMLIAEINREIEAQRLALKHQAEISEKQRREMGEAVNTARTFLKRDLSESAEHLAQSLDASRELLSERIKRAIDRARLELDSTLDRWSKIHHGTLAAVCRRGGSYRGSTGKNDFPDDLSQPVLNGIAFAWSEFFGEKLQQILEKWTDRLRKNGDQYQQHLFESLRKMPDLPRGIFDGMRGIFETTERVLDERLAQTIQRMEEKITERQRTIYKQVPEQVRANMNDAFEQGAEQSGRGMKARIMDILREHAHEVSQVMFDDAFESLQSGVRGLNDWLLNQYTEMAGVVDRNAELAADNLSSQEKNLQQDSVEERQAQLDELEVLLNQSEAVSV